MNRFIRLITTAWIALPLSAAAEDAPPKPAPELARLVGTWKGTGSLAMGSDRAKIDATWICKETSSRFGVLCTLHVTGMPGMARYEETDLMGYEPNTTTYHWYSVTNAAETHDHVAKGWNHGAAQFVFTGTQAGKSLKEVIDLAVEQDGKGLTGHVETFLAGASASVMDLTLHK
jgi:hypothetical protein